MKFVRGLISWVVSRFYVILLIKLCCVFSYLNVVCNIYMEFVSFIVDVIKYNFGIFLEVFFVDGYDLVFF